MPSEKEIESAARAVANNVLKYGRLSEVETLVAICKTALEAAELVRENSYDAERDKRIVELEARIIRLIEIDNANMAVMNKRIEKLSS